jgi:phytoene/squalene synthetase/2-polyprenyl-6-methoxyphenol hydroxylase-like FAD-dependent oxidoreductase
MPEVDLGAASQAYDVVVAGAGPVGAVCALAFARRSARVLLAEADPRAASRFAGEWIHPPGAAVLDRVGVGRFASAGACVARGFVVFPDDRSDPILLPYAHGAAGITCEHERMVEELRAEARRSSHVEYIRARVGPIRDDRVTLAASDGADAITVRAKTIVGADGRASSTRRQMGGASASAALSYMASVELHGVDLPFEGFGHVALGGPGPLLLYRIDDDRVRGCLDVPGHMPAASRTPAFLREAFGGVVPGTLANAFGEALRRGPVRWAATRFRPRTDYGRRRVMLVGDAVGYYHPMTAVGLTEGFLDAESAAQSEDAEAHRRRRERASCASELLASALYAAFCGTDTASSDIRRAIYRRWRASPSERERTVALLMGSSAAPSAFGAAFLRVAASALSGAIAEIAQRQRSGSLASSMAAYAAYAPWLVAGFAPRSVHVSPKVPVSTAAAHEKNVARRADVSSTHAPHVVPDADDWAYCRRSLNEVSRTFSIPIARLPERLGAAVTCSYLLCRVADTIEDHPGISLDRRDRLFALFLDVLNGSGDPRALADLVPPDGGVDPELRLVRGLPAVMRVFRAQPRETQDRCASWMAEMARGMQLYAHRPAGPDGMTSLLTISDLERYCYFVAGTVGRFLTELFILEIGPAQARADALRERAEPFGVGLQLVNIVKDVTDDHRRGICFVPQSVCSAQGLSASRLLEPAVRERAHRAVAPLFDLARERLDEGLAYTLAVPPSQTQIRLFCILPLCIAVRTLVVARGSDAVFDAQSPVKISRADLAKIVADGTAAAGDDAALRHQYDSLWIDERAAAPAGNAQDAQVGVR